MIQKIFAALLTVVLVMTMPLAAYADDIGDTMPAEENAAVQDGATSDPGSNGTPADESFSANGTIPANRAISADGTLSANAAHCTIQNPYRGGN